MTPAQSSNNRKREASLESPEGFASAKNKILCSSLAHLHLKALFMWKDSDLLLGELFSSTLPSLILPLPYFPRISSEIPAHGRQAHDTLC